VGEAIQGLQLVPQLIFNVLVADRQIVALLCEAFPELVLELPQPVLFGSRRHINVQMDFGNDGGST
jgi:hypothetical protein